MLYGVSWVGGIGTAGAPSPTTMTNSEIYTGALSDSDTNETVTAEDLGLTDSEYDTLVDASIDSGTAEGHVRAPGGRRVYAPLA